MRRPLSRTARLLDFPDCHSVACWQQQHAQEAYAAWVAWGDAQGAGGAAPGTVVCYNWGAATFQAPHTPGHEPRYHAYGDVDLSHDLLAAVFCLSVLDRLEAPLRFLRQMATRLTPGGLLVCTFAAWDATGPDCAVGHELRQRIYNRESWRKLLHDVRGLGLTPFGGVELRYHGDALGDHTLATLVVIRSGGRACV